MEMRPATLPPCFSIQYCYYAIQIRAPKYHEHHALELSCVGREKSGLLQAIVAASPVELPDLGVQLRLRLRHHVASTAALLLRTTPGQWLQ